MPLAKVFVKRFVVVFCDYYISLTTTGESVLCRDQSTTSTFTRSVMSSLPWVE